MKTDSELQRDVLDELKWEPSVNAAHIGVAVNDSIVILSGHVPSYWERYAAERAAKRVYGVKAVVNDLEIKLLGRRPQRQALGRSPRTQRATRVRNPTLLQEAGSCVAVIRVRSCARWLRAWRASCSSPSR